MHHLAERALRTIRRHQLIPRGARVAAAVSGGPDSVALTVLLCELERAGELVCAGIVHVNHQLRGDAAVRDERFSVAFARECGVRIEVVPVDARAVARARGTSVEDGARIARYAALRDAMVRLRADAVAVGHTRDDQAETFLLHVIRGAGSRGRRGIHPRRDVFIRPLLDIGRGELREYLRERGVTACHDETNDDPRFLRNRVRHELLPLLETRFSPAIVGVLARNAESASADEAYLAARAREAAAVIVSADAAGHVSVQAAALAALPDAIAWRVAADALEQASRGHERDSPERSRRGLAHAQQLVRMAAGTETRCVDLPRVRAERIESAVVLTRRAGRGAESPGNSFRYTLSIPGEVWLDEVGCGIAAEAAAADDVVKTMRQPPSQGSLAMVAAAALPAALTVRSRRPGDAFRPLGARGRKKLQDFFVDRKVRRAVRDRVPLVVAGDDKIVWVAGHAISDEFRVTDATQAVVILRLKESS